MNYQEELLKLFSTIPPKWNEIGKILDILFDTGHLRISEDGIVELSSKARMDYGATIPPMIVIPSFINKDFIRWRWDNYNGIQ